MKIVGVLAVMVLLFSGVLFAEENTLIDFNTLIDNYQGDNEETFLDYSVSAGTRFTEEEKAQMRTSLYLPRWYVRLTESSRTVLNDSLSYVKAVTVNDTSTQFAGEQVMGVRVHFPKGTFNSYAWVKPPFDIPINATNTVVENATPGQQFVGYGVVKNVGAIKSVRANVYGLNYPVGFGIQLRNEQEEVQNIPLGFLNFEGWRTLEWSNPNYVADARNRQIVSVALYPKEVPSVSLESLQYFRDSMEDGGDFINYVKDVVVTYDQAVLQDVDSEIDHEGIWEILKARRELRQKAEQGRIGSEEVLIYLEERRIHQDAPDAENADQ